MERRKALQSLAVAVGGLVSLPGWASSWNRAGIPSGQSFLAPNADALLAEVVEVIIPTTDTPGAKALGVHTFIQKIVTDCMEPSAQESLTKGLTAVEALAQKTYSKSFASLDAAQKTELLKTVSQSTEPDQKGFFSMVKGMTIQGYMTSEYVMNNITHYEFVPGRYHGCVPVVAKNSTSKNQQNK
ncbi:gluconate 2-dehydrogenase subunit 3 family protein [Larkinella rosea]|uniref:gluconate 2-dehydrogenase subunit 3 family protein n=1 Tax=Larkinella rosea TaxID=2025312 RepID=UPI001E611371|nr:gluconate 2-dehydrogenase subunit 3 family protein [Larkinella rosea]